MTRKGKATAALLLALSLLATGVAAAAVEKPQDVRDIGSRRELFLDDDLIERLQGASLKMHAPQLAPPSPKPRPPGHYATVIKDGPLYRFYSRGDKVPGVHWRKDGWDTYHLNEVTLYAESKDGVHWTEPDLGLYKVDRYPAGNVVLADEFLVNHNFTPFIDARPGVPHDERYKAVGGLPFRADHQHLREKYGPGGLKAFVSPDGIHWKRLRNEPIIPEDWGAFDSQNVAFWSDAEGCYVCYFRTFVKGFRSISRSTSADFVRWTDPVAMNANLPGEHLYTNGTHPYFRAPHLYVALPTRFQADRASITDVMLMSSRTGARYDRTFKEAFIRPGLGQGGWGNRSNYAAWHVVPTGADEMSIYVTGGRRYVMRCDGFASVHAGYETGEMVTKPLVFEGKRLTINFSTSAGGSVRAEIQDASGQAVPGFALDDCPGIFGDEIARKVAWKNGDDVSQLAGRPVRLRFVIQDADLFAHRFQ